VPCPAVAALSGQGGQTWWLHPVGDQQHKQSSSSNGSIKPDVEAVDKQQRAQQLGLHHNETCVPVLGTSQRQALGLRRMYRKVCMPYRQLAYRQCLARHLDLVPTHLRYIVEVHQQCGAPVVALLQSSRRREAILV
jgi:hypothetical protein